MPEATVALPWRATPERIPAHDRCVRYWQDNGFSVVEADSDPARPYLCNQSRNRAVGLAHKDIVIVADADTLPEKIWTIHRAMALVREYPNLVVWPHNRWDYISPDAVDEPDLTFEPVIHHHHDMSAVLVINRQTYWDLGGYDEGFTPGCWGYDDLAFHRAAETLTDTARLNGLVYSFDHGGDRDETEKNLNRQRYDEIYAPAIGNPAAMRRVVEGHKLHRRGV